jgi:SpoVK/Ycf46/Vps4 family AAA+-type ATPase
VRCASKQESLIAKWTTQAVARRQERARRGRQLHVAPVSIVGVAGRRLIGDVGDPQSKRRIFVRLATCDRPRAGWSRYKEKVMATADQVKALIRSHADGDDTRFYAIAMQVAAQAARTGHGKFAQELRDLVDQVKARAKAIEPARGPKPVPLAQPRGELAGLLTVGYPKTRLVDMALAAGLRARLERVLTEQRERDRLHEHGFSPMRKLLLVGPPGTGKTMTAGALAGELGLPLFSIQLDGLITKYMGETAAKLRIVFDAIQSTRGVYLFDEFDALGGERGSKNDVGEIRRVLNSFLQFLEQDESDSLVLGATNHVALLDRALFRRFDAVLEYALPTTEIAGRVMRARLGLLNTSSIDWDTAATKTEGLSHAEIAMACEQAAKNAILDHSTAIRETELVLALDERRGAHG